MEIIRSIDPIEKPLLPQLAHDLISELAERGLSITVAEGCSGGSLASNLTIPGATRAIHLGGIFYSTASKILHLGISKNLMSAYGEYSKETAVAMALAIREKRNDDFSIATVGDMNPDDPSKERIVYVGFSMRGREPWGKSITLHSTQRIQLKNELTMYCLSDALLYLRGHQHIDQMPGLQRYISTIFSLKREQLLPQSVQLIDLARRNGFTIGTIESCTGGEIANALTNVPGASNVFDTGWLAYDENVKAMLRVPLETMAYGYVYSEKVALAMAEALFNHSTVDIAISSTGLMDTIDTRPYHNHTTPGTIYAAVHIRNLKPIPINMHLPCSLGQTREDMKIEATRRILTIVLHELSLSVPNQEFNLPHCRIL